MDMNFWGRVLFGSLFFGGALILTGVAALAWKLTWTAIVDGKLLG